MVNSANFAVTAFYEVQLNEVLGTSRPGSEDHPFGEHAELVKLFSIQDFP
jgi:hypothetical protein